MLLHELESLKKALDSDEKEVSTGALKIDGCASAYTAACGARCRRAGSRKTEARDREVLPLPRRAARTRLTPYPVDGIRVEGGASRAPCSTPSVLDVAPSGLHAAQLPPRGGLRCAALHEDVHEGVENLPRHRVRPPADEDAGPLCAQHQLP